MDEASDLVTSFWTTYGDVIKIFLIVFFTMVIWATETYLYKKIHPRLQRTQKIWDDALVCALHKPLSYLILLTGFAVAATVAALYTNSEVLSSFIPKARSVGTVLLVVWFLIRLVKQIETKMRKAKHTRKLDETSLTAISQLLRTSVIITAGLILMETLGVPIGGVLAFGGMGGIAVGFAAKDLLANFFGSIMIFTERPFAIGDWIRSPEKQIEGTVEHIGWRSTRIRTFDKRPLHVPNSVFTTIAIENPSRMHNRRIYTHVGLRYEDAPKLKVILEDVEEMLRNHPEIDTNQTLFVKLVEFGPSSLVFQIYVFTKTTAWVPFQGIQQDIFLKIIEIITGHGAECAFPTTTLHIPNPVTIGN